MKRICIDPGHPSYFYPTQNVNWGAEIAGVKEHELTLTLALLLEKFLNEKGFSVLMTRHDNITAISNTDRAIKANEFRADLFLRIHADQERHGDTEINGVRTIYPPPAATNIYMVSWDIAFSIHRQIIIRTGLVDRGLCDERVATLANRDGMLGATIFANQYHIPTILLETVYLSNQQNREWIMQPEHQEIMMHAVVEGIENI